MATAKKRRDLGFGDPAVFDRSPVVHPKSVFLDKAPFYAAMNISTLLGWLVLGVAAFLLRNWLPSQTWHYYIGIAAVFISMIAGSIIAIQSASWKISGLAYLSLIAAPLGLLFGPLVLNVGVTNMVYALVGTAAWSVFMTLIGLAIKSDLQRLGFDVVISVLLLVYVAASVVVLILWKPTPTWIITMASIGIVIFSLGLVYNANRSKFVPKTLDRAVDLGMQNFLETVNIALRVMQILKSRS